MIGARSPVRRHDLIHLQRAVESAYSLFQRRSAQDITVGQTPVTQLIQENTFIYTAQLEQFPDRDGVHTGLRNIIPGALLIGVHPFLNGKRPDLHGCSSSDCEYSYTKYNNIPYCKKQWLSKVRIYSRNGSSRPHPGRLAMSHGENAGKRHVSY